MRQYFRLRSYLTFLRRNKAYTAINIFGFAVSLMFVLLLGLYTRQEYAVDRQHENRDRIYRLEHNEGTQVSAALAARLEERYPEIEATTRHYATLYDIALPRTDAERFNETAFLVDSTFFSIFSFSFLEGDASGVMRTPNDVVLTETFARKLFGHQTATGQTVKIQNRDYLVSGVVRDLKNSHFRNPAVFLSMQNSFLSFSGDDFMETLSYNNDFTTYILAGRGADLEGKMREDLEYFLIRVAEYWLFTEGGVSHPTITPLGDIYFSPIHAKGTRSNDRTLLTVFGATTLLILIFAVINYINLSVAQTGFRVKEAAMRRLLGSGRRELFIGFISESALVCIVSMGLAVGLAFLFQPFFRQMLSTEISLGTALTPGMIATLAFGALVLGALAGMAPALAITAAGPIEVVKGTFRRKTKMVYSKVLIGFQYCITIVLIGCTLTIIRQVRYMQQSDLGFNRDYILTCSNIASPDQRAGFRAELMAVPGVENVGFSVGMPGVGNYSGRFYMADGDGNPVDPAAYVGDTAFMAIMGFEMIYETGIEDASAVWINERMHQRLGLKDFATEYTSSRNHENDFRIRGVIKDFHIEGFDQPIQEAVVMPLDPKGGAGIVTIQVSSAEAFATMNRIGEVYNRRAGGHVFDGQFIDQRVQGMYQQQDRTIRFLGSLSLLAIVISSLGMLAMAAYFARQRAQEVAVRKVFGAMTREVLAMVMASFLKLVVIAFIIAIPIIWYVMQQWLTGYAYRISLGWAVFAAAGASVVLVAGLSVLWQSLRVANTNPILALKSE